ncbi:MAG: DUF1501 domain-containing protein [Planctomycetes bacterium]|nr:DUF1501 domain-containing protein [Planctomycetota bacterium]
MSAIDLSSLISRRALLKRSGLGFGSLAAAYLLHSEGHAAPATGGRLAGINLRPKPPHFPPQARAIIQLMQAGGPSQVDLFDPKPELQRRGGRPIPLSIEKPPGVGNAPTLLASPFKFHKRGRCGMELSELLPQLGTIADDITLVRSMHTGNNNHPEAMIQLTTGKIFPGRPTLGAWISYALGTENQNLPAYVVLRDPAGYSVNGKLPWSNGWLPALFQGVEFNSVGAPVLDLEPPLAQPRQVERTNLDLLARLNDEHRRKYPRNTELEARIRNYELAARMQLHAGEVLDLTKESKATRKLYGLDNPLTAGYGTRCLMARRLVEAGVRFVQVFEPAKASWDAHTDIKGEMEISCATTDGPVAGLVRDLKARGLLDETIVLWTGEFGRLPTTQKATEAQKASGRDHNRHAFSLWLAGGGFKAGYVHGATDDFGYAAVTDRVSVPDLHALLLHQLGLDHTQVTYLYHGRDETPTDAPVTGAHVIPALLQKPPRGV